MVYSWEFIMGVGICQWDRGGCNITVTIGEAKSIPLRFPLTGKTALHSFASPLPHGTRCAGLPRGPQGLLRFCRPEGGGSLSAARRAASASRFYSIARGLRGPGPCGYFCRAAKVTKNAPEPLVLDSFLGAALGRPPRRGSKGPCGGGLGEAKPPNWRGFFCRSGTCSTSPAGLLKGYCLQGAHGLTVHFAD